MIITGGEAQSYEEFELKEISMADNIIIGNGQYYSFRENEIKKMINVKS